MKPIRIRTGVDEGTQETAFTNATLQGVDDVAFSIATFVAFDKPSVPLAEVEVARLLQVTLERMLMALDLTDLPLAVSFEVEVGPANFVEEEER